MSPQQAYKLRHPDRIKASKEKWRLANPEKHAAHSKAWRERNPEKAKETYTEWAKRNPEYIYQKSRRRKSLLSGVEHDDYNRIDIFNNYEGICCICNKPIDIDMPPRHPESFTIQHIIPVSLGGNDTVDNIKPAHYSCNSRIGNRSIVG
jgi:hypothetical protein